PRQGAAHSALVSGGGFYAHGPSSGHWRAAALVAGQPLGRETGVYRVRKHVFGHPRYHALQFCGPGGLCAGAFAAHLRARRGADSNSGRTEHRDTRLSAGAAARARQVFPALRLSDSHLQPRQEAAPVILAAGVGLWAGCQ
nr:hypothetical protein [Tanacetum cinerariifolium]